MKKRPYKLITAIALLSITVVLLVIGIATGFFSKEDTPTLTEPVYLGMEVRGTLLESTPNFSAPGVLLGDLSNKGEEIDQENPFAGQGNIQQKIASIMTPKDSDVEFYTQQNQDIYIAIKLYNPDKLDILSVLFSGARYQKYQFELGSDHENVILKINVGTKSGIVKYKVEDIKFSMDSAVKDAFLEGETSVSVGIWSSTQVTAAIVNEVITTDKVSFSVKVADTLSLMQRTEGFVQAVLFDGVDIVSTKNLVVGDNIVMFEGLDSNKKYQYAVFAYYDNMSGGGASVNILSKKAFYTEAIVLFNAQKITVTQVGVSFDLLWNDVAANRDFTAEVFLGTEKKAVIDGTSVDGLLSGVEYDIVVTFTDLRGEKSSIKMTVRTNPKAVPVVEIDNIVPTKNSAAFDLVVTDNDSVGRVTAIELLQGEESKDTTNPASRVFTGLWSNTAYKIKVTYTYDLNDGHGERTLTEIKNFSTQVVPAPTFAIKGIVATKDSISFAIDITDPDALGAVSAVQLYKGNTLVKELATTGRVFDNLDLFTAYKIRVVYTYDLNDGKGNLNLEQFYVNAHTLADTKVEDISLQNSGAIKTGDTLQIDLELSDGNVQINKVKLNHTDFTPTLLSPTKLRVNIAVDNTFEGGDTDFEIEALYYTLFGTEYAIQLDDNNVLNVFINGKIEVKSLSFVDSENNPLDYSPTSSIAYITLNNKTGYTVNSATISGTKYAVTKVDDNHYKVSITISSGWQELTLDEIEYSNDYVASKLTISDINHSIYIYEGEIVEISDYTQLMYGIEEGNKAYKLMNNISVTGWNPVSFNGVFDGNGKTIDFAVNIAEAGKDIYLGLFSTAKGYIKNLNIGSAILTATLTGDGNIYAGTLVGREAARLEIFGVTVVESTITVSKLVLYQDTPEGEIYVGGLIGGISTLGVTTLLRQCAVKTDITATTNCQANIYAGGVAGYSRAKITDAVVFGEIKLQTEAGVAAYIGGLSGFNTEAGLAENIFSAVKITISARLATVRVGGLIGENKGAVANSVAAGKIEMGDNVSTQKGGVIGKNNSGAKNENNHSLEDELLAQKLDTEIFYTETLHWSQEIWDLSNLDFAGGVYPTLTLQRAFIQP